MTKVSLVVCGEEGALIITEVEEEDEEGQGGATPGRNGMSNDVRALMSQVNILKMQNDTLHNELKLFKATTNDLLSRMNTSLQQISVTPSLSTPRRRMMRTRRVTISSTSGGGGSSSSSDNIDMDSVVGRGGLQMNQNQADWTHSLVKCPKSLYVLWQKYEFGLGGRKPAKLFD